MSSRPLSMNRGLKGSLRFREDLMKYFNSANPEKFSFFVRRIIELVEV
ncbi:Uncharacterised protein [Mycobacterium tuberculosis]|nr:Uncharacterised protein [Mycobacterium tuberculosis]